MMTRVVLRSLVHAMHRSMHMHFVALHVGGIWIRTMGLPLVVFFLLVALLFHGVHAIVLVCLALVILFFFHGQ